MKKINEFVASRLVAGVLVVTPIYLAILLLIKVMNSLAKLLRPVAGLLSKWLPVDQVFSLLLVLAICFLIGLALQTPTGRAIRERIESSLFQRIPGYSLFRSLTLQLAGQDRDRTWKPALAEIAGALVPAFIIEELEDGRLTVFIPSVPSPLAGSIYILTPDRVHALNVPFMQAVKTVSRWGWGSKDLVAAMEMKPESLMKSSLGRAAG